MHTETHRARTAWLYAVEEGMGDDLERGVIAGAVFGAVFLALGWYFDSVAEAVLVAAASPLVFGLANAAVTYGLEYTYGPTW